MRVSRKSGPAHRSGQKMRLEFLRGQMAMEGGLGGPKAPQSPGGPSQSLEASLSP